MLIPSGVVSCLRHSRRPVRGHAIEHGAVVMRMKARESRCGVRVVGVLLSSLDNTTPLLPGRPFKMTARLAGRKGGGSAVALLHRFWQSAETFPSMLPHGLFAALRQDDPRPGSGEPQSVAWHAGALLRDAGARVLWSVPLRGAPRVGEQVFGSARMSRLSSVTSSVRKRSTGCRWRLGRARRPCGDRPIRSPMPIIRSGRRPFHQVARAAFLQP